MSDPAARGASGAQPPEPGESWTVLQLIRWSAEYLETKGIQHARLDVEHLLAHALETERLGLYLEFDRPVTSSELGRFKPLLLERARRKPLQYILGRTSFRALELRTDPRVLIPRPETEELVEAVLRQVTDWDRNEIRALDVGTGSGAIALSLVSEGSFVEVVATDASPAALEVARENARIHALEARIDFREGSGLDPVRPGERFDVLVSNPPYVTEREFADLDPEVRDWEPREALVAGGEGLDLLNELVDRAPDVLEVGGLIALEVGADQAPVVAERIRLTVGFDPPIVLRDLGRIERFVLATWGKGDPAGLSRRPADRLATSESA